MSRTHDSHRSSAALFGIQFSIALMTILGAAFAPPAQGRMLLVPVMPGAAAKLPAVALDHDMLLLGVGPFDGSLVVTGDRQALMAPLWRVGVIAIAAPPALCGDLLGDPRS